MKKNFKFPGDETMNRSSEGCRNWYQRRERNVDLNNDLPYKHKERFNNMRPRKRKEPS